jgi:hypothetical protein
VFWLRGATNVYLRVSEQRMMRIIFAVLMLLVFCGYAGAQTSEPLDTVFLMSGKVVTGVVKDTSNEKLKILIPKKGEFKSDFIDQELIFSVKYKTGTEKVFYVQDTLFGNYYTPNEIRYYLHGERDARKNYRCRLWVAGGFILGYGSGLFHSPILLAVPFGYSSASAGFRVKIRPGSISNPDYLRYDTYLLGYEKVARQKRLMRTMISGAIGFACGFATTSILYAAQNN